MTKRKWFVLTLLLLVGFGAELAYLCLVPRPGVTLANFERIEDGMTQKQVEELLGSSVPACINVEGYATIEFGYGPIEVKGSHKAYFWGPAPEGILVCFDHEGNMTSKGFHACFWGPAPKGILVCFDHEGKVASKGRCYPLSSKSFWDRFREWLGL